MALVSLNYGCSCIALEFDPERFDVLGAVGDWHSMSDAEIESQLDQPVDSPPLEDVVKPGQTILLVVPDATRQSGSGQIVNLLVRRLIANGTEPHDISIIFATGIHRGVTDAEKAQIVTPFILQRIRTLDHDARDLAQLVRLGETSSGIPVELNRALLEHDHVVIIGAVTFHYFAGFTGGRKLICPGLGSARMISGTHKLAFDCGRGTRAEGVDTGILDGNPVHEAFLECVRLAPPSFAVNSIVNDDGSIASLWCGDWQSSHRRACDHFDAGHTLPISERRELVIASCGGFPHDINMIQAHKTLDAASRACTTGGTIILLAECDDGLGRNDFLDWFAARDQYELARRLCEKYHVNGQTAWNLLRIADSHNVRVVTSLSEEACSKMRLEKTDRGALPRIKQKKNARGYILPLGAKFNLRERAILG